MTNIPKRTLGRTGAEVSILGLGGSHIGYKNMSDDEAISLIRKAIDSGITFMDNNWGYNDGRSEERMGDALQDGYRDRVFLMTKTECRDRDGALKQLDDSLRRLKTDHLDLWQIHEVIYDDDPALLSRRGGALEALDEAKRAGKARFVGFTGHKDPEIHLRTLDIYDWDTVQMPLNVMDAHFRSFEKHVLPVLLQRDIGVIGMKSFGDRHIVASGVVTPQEAMRYTLSLPVSTLVAGIDSMEILQQDLDIAGSFRPLTEDERDAILAKTAPLEISGAGRFELYKTSMQYDAEPGRKVHGFPPPDELAA